MPDTVKGTDPSAHQIANLFGEHSPLLLPEPVLLPDAGNFPTRLLSANEEKGIQHVAP